jgi:ABC-type transport system involved in multi-copper enzyme maturation permease subunit
MQSALPWLIDKGLLAIGLFIAILVTAPTIPQMFETGSLHLLLSKPISRSLLFLAKFVGGCAFVVICATYLSAGDWAFGNRGCCIVSRCMPSFS